MNIFVSLTTTNARLSLLFYTLQSLMRQNYRNFNIVVNVSRAPYLFDEGICDVPDWLRGENVSVRFVENSGPYRKLLPLIKEIDDSDLVVTADDDVLYAEDWLTKIVDKAKCHSGSIVCGRARTIMKNVFGRFQNYANWPLVVSSQHCMDLLPIGCSGVAYRKALLDFNFLFDEVFFDLAPTSDDIWFRLASLRKETKVFIDPNIDKGCIFMQHGMGLLETNLFKNIHSSSLYMKVLRKVMSEWKNYLGVAIAKNDYSWRNSYKYSSSKRYEL